MKSILKTIGNIILIGLLMTSMIYIGFNKLGGKEKITQIISNRITEKLSCNAEVSGLKLSKTLSISIDSIKLYDSNGEWLVINDIKVYLGIGYFFKNNLSIVAKELIYLHKPDIKCHSTDNNQSLWNNLDSFSTEFAIDKITIFSKNNSIAPYSFTVNGKIKSYNGKIPFNLNLFIPNDFLIGSCKMIPIKVIGYYDAVKQQLIIQQLSSDSELGKLTSSANVSIDDNITYKTTNTLITDKLNLIDPDITGNIAANFDLEGINNDFYINGNSTGILNNLQTKPIDLEGNFNAKGHYDNINKSLDIKKIEANYPISSIRGDINIPIEGKTSLGGLRFTNLDLNKVLSNVSGIINLAGQVTKSNNNTQLDINTEGDIIYEKNSPVDITGNWQGNFNPSNNDLDLDFKLKNNIHGKVKLKNNKNLLTLENINLQDPYNNHLSGNLQYQPKDKIVTGDLILNGSNFNKYSSVLEGQYKIVLNLNNCTTTKQIFNLSINRVGSPCAPQLQVSAKGNFNLSAELFEINALTAYYNNISITSNSPINIKKEKNNYKFNIPNLNWKNTIIINGNGEIRDSKIFSNLKFKLPIEAIFNNILPPAHQLVGKVNADINIQGNLLSPMINGTVDLENITYKYLDLGLSIHNLSAHLVGNNNTLTSTNCKLYDISNTMHTCNTKIEVNENNQHIVLALNADNFYIDIPAANLKGTIKADVSLNAGLHETILSGTITSRLLNIRIPHHIVPSIPELNVVEINNIAKTTTSYPFIFDINFKVPDKLYIKGRGVDGELGGNLEIKGNAQDAFLTGRLKTLRGKYEEFDKNFTIVKGDLIFKGPIPPSPFLDIEGLYKHAEANLYVLLQGPLFKPTLSTNSKPPLSTEEILSLILYGKTTQEINPIEAIILGDNFRRLIGKAHSNFNILGKARKLLHIDQVNINFNEDDTTKPSIQIGKHLTNKIMLKVEKGLKEGTAKTKIEYEILPYITVDGELGEEGHSGIGLNWKKDF